MKLQEGVKQGGEVVAGFGVIISRPPRTVRPSHPIYNITRIRKGFRGHQERVGFSNIYLNQIPLRDSHTYYRLSSNKKCLCSSAIYTNNQQKNNDCHPHSDSSMYLYKIISGSTTYIAEILYNQTIHESESNELNNAVKASTGVVAADNTFVRRRKEDSWGELEYKTEIIRSNVCWYVPCVMSTITNDNLRSSMCVQFSLIYKMFHFGFFGYKYANCCVKCDVSYHGCGIIIKFECCLELKEGVTNILPAWRE